MSFSAAEASAVASEPSSPGAVATPSKPQEAATSPSSRSLHSANQKPSRETCGEGEEEEEEEEEEAEEEEEEEEAEKEEEGLDEEAEEAEEAEAEEEKALLTVVLPAAAAVAVEEDNEEEEEATRRLLSPETAPAPATAVAAAAAAAPATPPFSSPAALFFLKPSATASTFFAIPLLLPLPPFPLRAAAASRTEKAPPDLSSAVQWWHGIDAAALTRKTALPPWESSGARGCALCAAGGLAASAPLAAAEFRTAPSATERHHRRSSRTVLALRCLYSGTTKPTPRPRTAAWATRTPSAEALVGRSAGMIRTEEDEVEEEDEEADAAAVVVFACCCCCCWRSCLPTAPVPEAVEREEEEEVEVEEEVVAAACASPFSTAALVGSTAATVGAEQ